MGRGWGQSEDRERKRWGKGRVGLGEVSGSGGTRSGGGTERTGNGRSYDPLDNSPMLAGLYIPERLTMCVTSKRGRNVPLVLVLV